MYAMRKRRNIYTKNYQTNSTSCHWRNWYIWSSL